MMKCVVCVLILVCRANMAERLPLPTPTKIDAHDESQIVKLAEEEKFEIPLSGTTISHEIEYVPANSGQCEFKEPYIEYKALAQSQAIFDMNDNIAAMLPLKKRELIFIADLYYNVASYSIDHHFLMKPRLPKTSLQKSFTSDSRPVNPTLVATTNEDYVYFLTVEDSYVFYYNNVAADSQGFKLEGSPDMILRAIEFRGFILVCTGTSGIMVYQIVEPSMGLKLIYKEERRRADEQIPIDMELNEDSQLLYVLNDQKTIDVYLFDPVKWIENPTKKQNTILQRHDQIDMETITKNHQKMSNPFELVGHINIEISRTLSAHQSILILFSHQGKSIVAELTYHSHQKQFSFVRYFKYSMLIQEIHAIKDLMVIVGDGLLGMFPYGIDPHLIVEEFNGYMTLTPVEKIVITEAPFFVGVSKNEIEYGGIFLNNEAGINCHLGSSSQLKEVKFKANLTICRDMSEPSVSQYCEYEKTFIIRQMEMTATAPVATSLWVITIIFTLLIVVGLCFLFAMHKKKEREIRKLELYFEEKRRSAEIPASSER